ncbi:hypothetical protein, partial [Bradyrhizobium japonicum]|uniref:hypothetical protein n=1 Tax=Bradyrhizobium japonicum TaxID=375 RepID=UPI001AEBB67E
NLCEWDANVAYRSLAAAANCRRAKSRQQLRSKVGAVRIRVRGTVDRRALCEVLAAVGTVGR